MIAIVDYQMNNLYSVRRALITLDADAYVAEHREDLRRANRLVLPGTGAFGEAVCKLRESGMLDALREEVIVRGKPLFGICLGMQLLASCSTELGNHEG